MVVNNKCNSQMGDITKGNCINVNILVVTLHYSFKRCYHWVKLGKGHTGSLCIISYSCMWIYKYLRKFLIYKNGAQIGSMVNSTTYLKKGLYQFSTIPSRRLKQKGYFLAHSIRPASPKYRNQTKKRQTMTNNNFNEHRCKEPQQNIWKSTSTMYKKNDIP